MSALKEALARLDRIGGKDLVQKMIDAFRRNASTRIESARQALAAGDLAGLERAAHSLKSSSGNIGAAGLAAIAAQIEDLAAKGKSDHRLGSLVEKAAQSFAEIEARLEREPTQARKRVAVIEDNQDNRLLVHAILEDQYTILEYETGAEALRGVRVNKPDVVLLDISLPGMDGTEVLKVLRGDPGLAGLPVIALTAHAMAGDRQKYLDIGFDDYISKPIIDENILLEAIGRLVR